MSPHSPLYNYPVIAANSGVAVEDLNTNKKSLRVEEQDHSEPYRTGAVPCRAAAGPSWSRAVPEPCQPCRSRADEVAVLGPEAKLPLLSRFRYLRQRRNGLSSM